jgi:hypothetical protein
MGFNAARHRNRIWAIQMELPTGFKPNRTWESGKPKKGSTIVWEDAQV